MRILACTATILILCGFVASSLLAGDCSGVYDQIAVNKNKPAELRKLLEKAPQCGEVWEALGDYYYGKKVWNEAKDSYEEALKLLPGKNKIISRLQELRPKVTALIKDEKELLAYKRGIGGTTHSMSGSASDVASPPSQDAGEERIMIASARENKSAPSKKTTERRVKLASKPDSPSRQAVRPKAEKVGLIINFDYDSSQLTPESKKLLSGFAEVLNGELAGGRFLVQGHTDNKGERQYNKQLSMARAKSVKYYLSSRNVDPARLQVQGFGMDKPIYDNDTEEGRAKNRRVEFEEK